MVSSGAQFPHSVCVRFWSNAFTGRVVVGNVLIDSSLLIEAIVVSLVYFDNLGLNVGRLNRVKRNFRSTICTRRIYGWILFAVTGFSQRHAS
jgi:hypothetical protein